jgi:O-antigen/teichoic acid export membrane protein
MLDKIKHLLRHSFIYSLSSAAPKLSGVVLLPLYTYYLLVSEFGVLGVLDATIIILFELVSLGQGHSLVMLNSMEKYEKEKKSIFFTITLFSMGIILIFVIAGEFGIPLFFTDVFERSDTILLLRLALYVIALRSMNELFLNKFRADENSGLYSLFSITKLLLQLGVVSYLFIVEKLGLQSVLYAYLVSEGTILLLMGIKLLPRMEFKLNPRILPTALQFGFPLVFSALAMMILNVSDRYILQYIRGEYDVGLYDLAYRLSGVLNMFFIMPFTLTFYPAAYKLFGKEGDKRFYSKSLTYLTFVLVWGGLAMSLFAEEILMILSQNPEFVEAYKVVPILLLSYVFFGMRLVVSLPAYLKQKTSYVVYITVAAAGLNVGLNFLFIPEYGMLAAALNTLAAFFLLSVAHYFICRKIYTIPFELFKLFALILLGTGLYCIIPLLAIEDRIVLIGLKLLIVFVFPFLLYIFGFYDKIELERIGEIYNKWIKPSRWKYLPGELKLLLKKSDNEEKNNEED